jgi:lysophospholipase L2
VASLECSRRGTHYYSRALQELAFGPFNRAFENPRTAFDWLSRDRAQVDAYLRDPLCGFTMTTGFFKALVGLTLTVSKPRRIARMSKDLPILLISGANDPVGGQGKGVRAVARTLQKAGLSEVTMRLYPEARHEILNELNRDEVIADLLAWAQSVIAGDKIPAATTL